MLLGNGKAKPLLAKCLVGKLFILVISQQQCQSDELSVKHIEPDDNCDC